MPRTHLVSLLAALGSVWLLPGCAAIQQNAGSGGSPSGAHHSAL